VTFVANQNWANGATVQMSIGAAQNGAGKNIQIAEADLRATPGLAVGLQANPPPAELRPIHEETVFCQRYYERGSNSLWGGYVVNTMTAYHEVFFAVTKRTVPSVVTADLANGGFPAGAPSANNISPYSFSAAKTANGGPGGGFYNFSWTASAEL
jgi:hypothetical protein